MTRPAVASSAKKKKHADLSATLTNKTARPGHRVSYKIKVTNHGPSTAQKVQFDFSTTRSMTYVSYQISSGRCIRSPKETVCLLGTMKAGHSGTATISGVLSKKLKKGAAISNKVTVLSDTHLINTSNDVVTDDYQIGIHKTAPVPAAKPVVAATPGSKLNKITHVATDAIDVTSGALRWSEVALAAAAVWFAVGLTTQAVKRRRSRNAERRGPHPDGTHTDVRPAG